ncbi:MAG TPA: JAB domain-containing protein [Verrucomicrobiae bacterium]
MSATQKNAVKVKTHRAVAEFKIVRLRECPVDGPIIEHAPEVVDFWRKHVVTAPWWFKEDKECLVVFLLNTRHRLLGFELVSQGTLDTILMHPRDVFRLASIRNAASIIIAHNHPSGDPLPSDADIKVTMDLIRAAAMMKIELIDHIIIGDAWRKKGYASLRGLECFQAEKSGIPIAAESKSAENSYSLIDLEQTANKVCGLIELFEAKLSDFVRNRTFPSSLDFDSVISSADCGFQTLAHEIKKELVEGVRKLFENSRAEKAATN